MTLIVLIVIMVICQILTSAYQYEQGERLAVRTNGIKAVHDIIHEYMPDLSKYWRLYNPLLLVFLSPLVAKWGSYPAWEFLIATLSVLVPATIFRCATTSASLTTRTTSDVDHDFGGWLKRQLFGSHDDKMFSGHMLFSITLVLTMLQMGIITDRALWMTLIVGYGYFSTASRQHYTGDVLLAFPVAFFFFDAYHCDSATRRLLMGQC